MSEWWSYRPEDFLLFSERVYWRLFEIHNQAYWPAHLVAIAVGAILLFLVLWPRQWSGRAVSTLLAVAWVFVAWAYFWNAYATINLTARFAAGLFAAEALLFIWLGVVRDKLIFEMRRNPGCILSILLIFYALFIHPLVPMLTGQPTARGEVFGLTPDPTAMATIGLLGLLAGGRGVLMLLPIPVVWCLVSWATLQTMGTWEGWIPLAAVISIAFTRPWRRMAPNT